MKNLPDACAERTRTVSGEELRRSARPLETNTPGKWDETAKYGRVINVSFNVVCWTHWLLARTLPALFGAFHVQYMYIIINVMHCTAAAAAASKPMQPMQPPPTRRRTNSCFPFYRRNVRGRRRDTRRRFFHGVSCFIYVYIRTRTRCRVCYTVPWSAMRARIAVIAYQSCRLRFFHFTFRPDAAPSLRACAIEIKEETKLYNK